MQVGEYEKKEVSKMNHFLYKKAEEIIEDDDNQGESHMGRKGISAFIDWLEEHYTIRRK